jgi:hypothetical protein
LGLGQAPGFKSPEAVVARLEREHSPSPLANALHLSSCGRAPFECADASIKVSRPRLDAAIKTATLQIEIPQFADLVVLRENREGNWEWADTLHLDFAYEPLKLEFKALVRPPVEEIVVHNNTAQHGSGLYFGHFLVVKLIEGRLRVVFAATAQETVSGWPAPDRQISSSFRLDALGRDPATITQTSHYQIGNRSGTVIRSFAWDDRFLTFLPEMGEEIR